MENTQEIGKNGKRSGFGALTMNDQSEMEGHWQNGSLLYGEYKDNSGVITYGNGARIGHRREIAFPDGDQFCGKFNPDGTYQFGTLSLSIGETYFGESKEGIYHGNGVLNDGTEGIYTGNFWKEKSPALERSKI